MVPKSSGEVLFSVPKDKAAVMCLTNNVLDELCSGMSYNATGHGFNVNESITYKQYTFNKESLNKYIR